MDEEIVLIHGAFCHSCHCLVHISANIAQNNIIFVASVREHSGLHVGQYQMLVILVSSPDSSEVSCSKCMTVSWGISLSSDVAIAQWYTILGVLVELAWHYYRHILCPYSTWYSCHQ